MKRNPAIFHHQWISGISWVFHGTWSGWWFQWMSFFRENRLTGHQPDFPMKIMGCSCNFSRKNRSIECPKRSSQECGRCDMLEDVFFFRYEILEILEVCDSVIFLIREIWDNYVVWYLILDRMNWRFVFSFFFLRGFLTSTMNHNGGFKVREVPPNHLSH